MWLYNLISVVGVKVPERAFGDSGRSVHGHGKRCAASQDLQHIAASHPAHSPAVPSCEQLMQSARMRGAVKASPRSVNVVIGPTI